MNKIRTFGYVLRNSLTNFDYYREIKNVSFWFSLKYLYLLLLLTSFISILPVTIGLVSFAPRLETTINNLRTEAKNAYPPELVINIKDGQLTTNVDQPYYLGPKFDGKTLLVIDTRAKIEDYTNYKSRAYALVTKTAAVYPKNSGNQTEIFFFSELKQNVTMDVNSYRSLIGQAEPYLRYVKPLFWAGLVILILLGPLFMASSSLSWTLISLLFFSFVVYLITKLLKGNFSYKQIYKIAMHASTLPILFFTLLGLIGLSPKIPFGYSLVLIIFMIIIFNRIWKTSS